MLDIFSIDFEAKITKCILEKNETENIVTLDVSFYDASNFDKELFEDIDFQKYYFLKSELISNKNEMKYSSSFQKDENILQSNMEKVEFEVINNLQVRVIKKQFSRKFKEDYLELKYSFGLDTNQIKLDFPFLKDQISNLEKDTVKKIVILEDGMAKEFVQDFRNLSFQKSSPLTLREKYNKISVDTLFEKNIDLSEKLGAKNSFISKFFTTYGEEQRGDSRKTNVYLYFYIDSQEFINSFYKYPKLIENPPEELKEVLEISATINESTETKSCELQICGTGSKYLYYRVKFDSELTLDKKIILNFFSIDLSFSKAKEVFANLSEVIRSLKEERWVNAKFFINKIPVILNDSKKQILEIISTERRDIINQLIMNLQQIYLNYSTIIEGSGQTENVSATNQPAYSSKNVVSFNKEIVIPKEHVNYIDVGRASGIRDSKISFLKLKKTLDEKLKKYYDSSLTSVELSKEKTVSLEDTKYSYLNFDVEKVEEYFSILGENLKDIPSVIFGLLKNRKLENKSQITDSILSNGVTFQEESVFVLSNMSQAAAQLDFIFGVQKPQEIKKIALGNFDDTLDYSKFENTMRAFYILQILEEVNKRDCELEYYNLKIDTFMDLKFALLDLATSLAGDSYLNRLPNSTKCLFGMFGKDSSKIKKDSDFFKDNLVSYDRFLDFFIKYQFVFEIKYLQVGGNANITHWKRLTMDKVNSLGENEKLMCKLEVFEDDNIVSTKLLSKLHYSLRDEYFMMGK